MAEVGVHEAKTHFSKLLKRVAAGEEIVVTSSGEPVARIIPFTTGGIVFGVARGEFVLPDDFDEPDPEIEEMFYGSD